MSIVRTACLVLALGIASSFVSSRSSGEDDGLTRCSVVNLLATPAAYDGKRVQVIGYVRLRFEGNALFLTEQDAANEVASNSVWLDVSSWDGTFRGPGYAIIEGTFSATDTGHMGMWPGAITRLERLDPWPPAIVEEE